ncbi:MAG: clostripain-related cysteine peptidase [Mucinivorans sp.]
MVSCNKNGGEDPQPTLSDYTVMVYGCAGGNLDDVLDIHIEEVIKAKVSNVPMTWCVKYSKQNQSNPDKAGLRRFAINENGIENLEVMSVSTPLYKPENLADFIKWSTERYPAKKYILLMWNHGGGWSPTDDGPKRSVIFDDNLNNVSMSLDEVAKGVALSGVKLDVIHYDACLMGCIENLTGLTSVADYALMSNHSIYGGQYTFLRNALSSDANPETALAKYGNDLVSYYRGDVDASDIVFTRLNKVSAVNEVMKKVSQELVSTYDQYKDGYDRALTDAYIYTKDYPFYDIDNYVSLLAKYSDNPRLKEYLQNLRTAMDQAIIFRDDIGKLGKNISWSITAINKAEWADNGYNNGNYEALAFDKATGWSQWLKLNESKSPDFPKNPEDDHK